MKRSARNSSLPLVACLACSASALIALNLGVASGSQPNAEVTVLHPPDISELQCAADEELVVFLVNVIDSTLEPVLPRSGDKAIEPDPPLSVDEAIEKVADGPVIPGDAEDLTATEVVQTEPGHRTVSMSDGGGESALVTLAGSQARGWTPERIEVCQP